MKISAGFLSATALGLTLAGQSIADTTGHLPATLQEPLRAGGVAPALVLIPAGRFDMGSPDNELGRFDDEGPRVTVGIDDSFYLGRTEVTVAEFTHFVSVAGYEPDSEVNGCYLWRDGELNPDNDAGWANQPGFESGPNFPAVCVSWRDAFRYVEWLSEQTGASYRLPSEAEWEYAARAGSEEVRYWGQDSKEACRHANVADLSFNRHYEELDRAIHDCDDGFPQTAPVASFSANQFGLHDTLGNVWEWTCSVFGPLDSGAALACVDFWASGSRVLRGGGWYIPPDGVRSAHRNAGGSGSQTVSVGFRVLREV